MHDIHMSEVSPDFAECWQAAGRHLQHQAQGSLKSWLRAHLKLNFGLSRGLPHKTIRLKTRKSLKTSM